MDLNHQLRLETDILTINYFHGQVGTHKYNDYISIISVPKRNTQMNNSRCYNKNKENITMNSVQR
jgi:hypothetical protein